MGGADYLLLAAVAAALSAVLTPLVRRLAIGMRAMDLPDGRRVHSVAMPRLGGVAVIASVGAALLVAPLFGVPVVAHLALRGWHLGWLLAGVLVVVLTGVWDDLRGLAPVVKLGLVLLAAMLALAGDFGLLGFTNPLTGTYVSFGALGGLVTVVWIVAVTHAFNLVDGLDGLASGVALLASVTLFAVSLFEGRQEAALLWAIVAGALAGFLPFNFFPATVFLGDSGSLFLGYVLAVLALQSLEKSATLVIVLVPVLALGLPVTEIGLTLLRRIAAQGPGSVFRADSGHIHHRLLGSGLSHRGAVLTLYALCAGLSGFAFLALVVQGPWNALLVGGASLAIFGAIRWLAYGRPNSAASPASEGGSSAGVARVAVVVLGDLGRSPRMLYHALALADAGARVELIGYSETDLFPALRDRAAIRVRALRTPARRLPDSLFLVRGALRVVGQAAELLWVLLAARPDTILVQTPPAVPTLLVGLVAARCQGARFAVDWHNSGWSMLALRLPERHWLVRGARHWERLLGRRADLHFCVSQAMAGALATRWGIDAVVLRDCPAERFAAAAPAERADLRARLAASLGLAATAAWVVAPSGWTADEDVDLLIDAATRLDSALDAAGVPGRVVIVATGRGPLREQWERRVASTSLRHVHLCARWLAAAEYPAFLAAADLGISLHRSASGLDLPMKIADMIGAGVPVCALSYAPCVAEMLRDGETGLLFTSADELATQLAMLLRGAQDQHGALAMLRRSVARHVGTRWGENWRAVAGPLLLP